MDGTLDTPYSLVGTLSQPESLVGTLSQPESILGTLTLPTVISPDTYEGAYTVVPLEEEQILETADLLMLDNVRIGAVPANYGRLDYNGQYLRVY